MRRAGPGLALLVLLLAAHAHADWTSLPLDATKTPSGVMEAWGPGIFSVGFDGTMGGVWLIVDGKIDRTLERPGLSAAGAFYEVLEDCLIVVARDGPGARYSLGSGGGSCSENDPLTEDGDIRWTRHARGGRGAVLVTSDKSRLFLSDTHFHDLNFLERTVTPQIYYPDTAPGAVWVGNQLHAFLPTERSSTAVYWFEGVARRPDLLPSGGSFGFILTLDAFAASGGSHLVVGTDRGFLKGSTAFPGSLNYRQPVPGGKVNSLSMNVEDGSAGGHGFGMAVVLQGSVSRVMGAVPMPEDTLAGTVWRDRNDVPTDMRTAPFKYVQCEGANSCLFITSEATGPNTLYIYDNRHPPELVTSVAGVGATWVPGTAGGVLTLDERTHATFTFEVSDADQDPLRVTASGLTGTGGVGLKTVFPPKALANDGLELKLEAGPFCKKDESVGTLRVKASDGKAGHDDGERIDVRVRHTQAPQPRVLLPDETEAPPGLLARELTPEGDSLTLRIQERLGEDCPLTKKAWTPLAVGPELPELESDPIAGTATLAPPKLVCEPKGQDLHFTLEVEDEGELERSLNFTVHVTSNRVPFENGRPTLKLEPDPFNPDRVQVKMESDLNCAEQRGLRANVKLTPRGHSGTGGEAELSVSSDWRPSIDPGCAYRLTGTLKEDGLVGAPLEATPVDLPGRAPGLEFLPGQDLTLRCGERASTTLTATAPEGTCQTPGVTWSQTSGPLLERSENGREVTLVTPEVSLNTLLDKPLVMKATAVSGPGLEVTKEYTLPVSVEPFVKVRRRTETPTASETGLVGVSVELINDTNCGVEGVRYTEQLEGLAYVEGSARLNGQAITPGWEEGTLTLEGLALEARSTATLVYVARPHLVGERRMVGEVSLNERTISLRDGDPPPAPEACGCSGSGPSPLLFALGALVAVRRRRR